MKTGRHFLKPKIMTKRDARKKMIKAVGRLKTPLEHRFKEAHFYSAPLYYRVEDICKALGVSVNDFFSKSLRSEIILFNSGIKLKV